MRRRDRGVIVEFMQELVAATLRLLTVARAEREGKAAIAAIDFHHDAHPPGAVILVEMMGIVGAPQPLKKFQEVNRSHGQDSPFVLTGWRCSPAFPWGTTDPCLLSDPRGTGDQREEPGEAVARVQGLKEGLCRERSAAFYIPPTAPRFYPEPLTQRCRVLLVMTLQFWKSLAENPQQGSPQAGSY